MVNREQLVGFGAILIFDKKKAAGRIVARMDVA